MKQDCTVSFPVADRCRAETPVTATVGSVSDDPRIAKTRAAVLSTAADLVVECGPHALTIDAVVSRSGVARSTIYRHWPTRDALLVGVFEYCVPTFETPAPDLSFEQALRAFVRNVLAQLSDPKWARMMPALTVLKVYEPALAHIEGELEERQRELSDDLLARGVREGILPPDVRSDWFTATVVGPIVFALITGLAELTPEFADELVDNYLAGRRARRGAPI